MSNRIGHVSFCGALRSRRAKGQHAACTRARSPHDHRDGAGARKSRIDFPIGLSVTRTASEDQINRGTLNVEFVAQGILGERCHAGGAGIRAFYFLSVIGSKRARVIEGRPTT